MHMLIRSSHYVQCFYAPSMIFWHMETYQGIRTKGRKNTRYVSMTWNPRGFLSANMYSCTIENSSHEITNIVRRKRRSMGRFRVVALRNQGDTSFIDGFKVNKTLHYLFTKLTKCPPIMSQISDKK